MPALRSLIAILFLGLCLASPPLLAQSEPPSAEAVQQSLDKLAERKLAEADQKVAKASLEQTLVPRRARRSAAEPGGPEKAPERRAPADRGNQRELERLKKTKERPVSERYSGESAARLEMLLNDRTTQQAEWQKALGEANSLSITAETRPERAQAGISSMQARILEIGSLLKAGKESGKTINADRRGESLAEQAALTVQSQLLRQELAGNNLLQDLGKSQHDLLTEKISRLEKENPRPAGADQREAPRAVGKDRRRAVQGRRPGGRHRQPAEPGERQEPASLRLPPACHRPPQRAHLGATSRPSSNWTT
ncbi:hypothetical protein ACPA9J_05740 [Pseudomonas aeruginosa]